MANPFPPLLTPIVPGETVTPHWANYFSALQRLPEVGVPVVTPPVVPVVPTPITRVVGVTVDGAGSVITTGVKGYLRMPVDATITQAVMLADQTGSAVIDVWRSPFPSYPPTSANAITASTPPTLSTAASSMDVVLAGWSTTITADDVLAFSVTSATTVTRVTLELTVVS
jgi:hypothetical protein